MIRSLLPSLPSALSPNPSTGSLLRGSNFACTGVIPDPAKVCSKRTPAQPRESVRVSWGPRGGGLGRDRGLGWRHLPVLAEGPRVPAAVLQIRAGGAPGVWGGYKKAGAAGGAPRARPASAMLSAQERAQVAQVWDLIAGHEASFGAELLLRWVEAGFPRSQGGGHGVLGPEAKEWPRREIPG